MAETKGFAIKEKSGKILLDTISETSEKCSRYFHLSLDDMSDFESQTKGTKVIPVIIKEEGVKPSRSEIQEKVLQIIQENYNQYTGTNEAELASSEDIADYVLGIKEEGEERGWISLETRLPEFTESTTWYDDENKPVVDENTHAHVLGYNPKIGIFRAVLCRMGWREVSTNSSNSTIIPTHWTPLPKPPRP